MPRQGPKRYLEQGVAIISVLLVLSILAMIGLGIATMGQGATRITIQQTNAETAYLAAEAAALYACDELAKLATLPNTPMQVPMQPGGQLWRPLSPTSPDTILNATVSGWDSGTNVTGGFVPPGSLNTVGPTNRTIQIPPEHCYVVGCGTVNNSSITKTVRYVGLMVRKTAPGGVYYYGAYAKNVLDTTNNMTVHAGFPNDGFVDAFDGTKGVYAGASSRIGFADIEGAGSMCNVSGQAKIYGNAAGTSVNATGTNFNNMGKANMPGPSMSPPNPPWPTMGPSPGYDLQVSAGQRVFLVNQSAYTAATGGPFVPPPVVPPYTASIVLPDTMQWDDIDVTNGELVFIGTPGGTNFQINDLMIFGPQARVTANTSLLDPNIPTHKVGIYVNQGSQPGNDTDEIAISGGANVSVDDSRPSQDNRAGLFNFYFNGTNMKICNDNTNVTATFTATNSNVNVQLYDQAHLTGSLLSANNITIRQFANLHYDTNLRKAGVDPNSGKTLKIVSHQRL